MNIDINQCMGVTTVGNKKNKKVLNIIMIAVIAAIIVAGITAVGAAKGWFSGKDEALANVKNVSGIASVERNDISFELGKDDCLEAGDKIRTNSKAEVTVESGENVYILSENTSMIIEEAQDDKLDMEVAEGEIFVILNDGENFGKISAQERKITAGNAVFSVNLQTGSMGVNVFEGAVTIEKEEAKAEAEAGQAVSAVGDEMSVIELKAESLNKFNIEKALSAIKDHDLCFSEEELNKILEDRETESAEAVQSAEDISSGSKDADGVKDKGEGGKNNGGSKEPGRNESSETPVQYDYFCTIEIRCDTILSNMANLQAGKEGYVPSDGVILRTVSAGFNEGETVFDVLKRVCKARNIQIEYSYTPAYGSSYIEGINHIYEFDCGNQSGWMYKVNGWFPNYGCSSYELKDGDAVAFLYTCNGYGNDVGGGLG